MSHTELVVARQAIYDARLEVAAYELLFRSFETDDHADQLDGDLMTSTVLFSALNIGVDRLVADKLVFCNADRGLLTGRLPVTLPPDRTVIEVLETVELDLEVLEGCRKLVRRGYRIALDDFVWVEGAEPFLELASIVKIDLRRLSGTDELIALVERCRTFDVELLAEKVETEEELQLCRDLGFDYFQGYALSRPRVVAGRALESTQLGALRMSASLLGSEFDLDELEQILRTEPALALQLLQLAAIGARGGLRREIRTLRDALILVGAVRVQSWIALLLLRKQTSIPDDGLTTALARARMCEMLSANTVPHLSAVAFTAGILSAFDVLLGVEASEIDRWVPLDDELREAAFGQRSPVGKIVRDVADYQAGRTTDVRRSGLSDRDFDLASMDAIMWAVEATHRVAAA
ncbi:EAL domain-containing protein [Jatrophihabitans telluris]|uniref:EAL domain-containing protein n=1 Tax=Jatrophihabitans telluris TaxID=2038343 RepID=A0ABY4QUW3_9ACTN|nr:EAL domain-containing protein [Jatrophihabitans telluris]UQX86892.1 EAL domain-containing protein [Jatrophihabitans telluris]